MSYNSSSHSVCSRDEIPKDKFFRTSPGRSSKNERDYVNTSLTVITYLSGVIYLLERINKLYHFGSFGQDKTITEIGNGVPPRQFSVS